MNTHPAWQPELRLMNTERLDQMHAAATTILEKVSLNVHHADLRKKLAASGAKLGEGVQVYLPSRMVSEALETASSHVVVHNRSGEPVMALGPHQIYFGTGSDLIFSRAMHTGEHRKSTQQDAANAAHARAHAREIISDHQPEPLEPDLSARMGKICSR